MSPARGLGVLLTLLVGAAWYSEVAPRLGQALVDSRANSLRSLTASDLRFGLDRLTRSRPDLAPSRRVRSAVDTILREGESARRLEDAWNLTVADILTDAQRRQAETLEPGLPEVVRSDAGQVMEPEMPALALQIMRQYGYRLVPLPPVPKSDRWAGRTRRDRARFLLALVAADVLHEDQAAMVLTLTLVALHAQADRMRNEERASALLAESTRAALR